MSVVILAALTSAVVFGPFVWRVPINEIDFTVRLGAPSWQHPFGTDDLGQDLLARMLYGELSSSGLASNTPKAAAGSSCDLRKICALI